LEPGAPGEVRRLDQVCGLLRIFRRCEEVLKGRKSMEMLCRKVQLLKYAILLRYCAEQAVV
jgi:hypothetical protein